MAVPTPAITASLYARFYSREEGDYAARVLAALRNQFGGHAVQEGRGDLTMAVDVTPDPQALGENPLIEGLERLPVPATTLTIFGAPATSRTASCCPRSTTSPTRARCPSAST